MVRVDNDNHFASFFAKKWLQTIIVFREKWREYRDNRYFVKNKKLAIIAKLLLLKVDHLVPSTALYSLYAPLSPLRPSVPSAALCPLYGPLSPLRPSVPSTALCPLSGPQSHLKRAKQAKRPSCFAKSFAKCVSSKLQGLSISISYKW